MPPKGEKLLQRMRLSKQNWKRHDLITLYEAFGFTVSHGGEHDIVRHKDYPQLRTTVPRHNKLAKGYVEYAVKLVDRLLQLQAEAKNATATEPQRPSD
jgi:hypothetical protein